MQRLWSFTVTTVFKVLKKKTKQNNLNVKTTTTTNAFGFWESMHSTLKGLSIDTQDIIGHFTVYYLNNHFSITVERQMPLDMVKIKEISEMVKEKLTLYHEFNTTEMESFEVFYNELTNPRFNLKKRVSVG